MKVKILKFISFSLGFIIIFGGIVGLKMAFDLSKKPQILLENKEINLNQQVGSEIKNILTHNNYIYITVSNINSPDKVLILNNNHELVSTINLRLD